MSFNWKKNLWVAWGAQILSLSGFNFALPFLPYYIQQLGVTDLAQLQLWTGVLTAAPALTMGLMAPVWGYLADKWGKKIMLLRAMFFGSIIIGLLYTTKTVVAVVVLRLLQGLFTGTVTASSTLVAAGTPRDKLSYALGMLSSSNFIGISIGPLFGGLAAEWLGYRPSFLIGSAVLACGFFLVLFGIKEVTPAAEPTADNSTANRPEQSASIAGRSAGPTIFTMTVISCLFMLLVLRFSRVLPIPFIPLYIQDFLGKVEGAASITGIISFARGAVTALAGVTLVRLGDRYPKLGVIAILLLISTVLSIPVSFMNSIFGFSAVFVVATFFLGGIEPLLQSEIIGNVPASKQGVVFGIQTAVGNIGWFLAPMVGSLISIRFGNGSVFLAMVFFLGISALLALAISKKSAGKQVSST